MTELSRESLAAAIGSVHWPGEDGIITFGGMTINGAAAAILAELEKQALPSPVPEPPPDPNAPTPEEELDDFKDWERAAQPAPDLDPLNLIYGLRNYAQHYVHCRFVTTMTGVEAENQPCDCGFDDVLRAMDRLVDARLLSKSEARGSGGEP